MLDNWYQGEAIVPVDRDVLLQQTTVKPLPRGNSVDVTTSLSEVITSGVTFQWWQKDQEGVTNALDKDTDLKNSCSALSEIVETLQKENNADPLLSLALLERAAEIDLLIKPHIPASIYKEIVPMEDNNREKSLKKELRLPKEDDDEERDTKTDKKESKLQELSSKLVMFLLSKDTIKTASTSSATRVLQGTDSNGNWQSPFTSLDRYSAGEERKSYPGDKRLPQDTVLELISPFQSSQNSFAVIQIANVYDNSTGILTAVATKNPAKLSNRSSLDETFISYIPKKDIENATEVALPHAVPAEKKSRADYIYRSFPNALRNITIFSKKTQKALVQSHELEQFVYQDSLGNFTLNLELMPPELRDKFKNHDLTIATEFTNSYYNRDNFKDDPDLKWQGPIKKAEQGSLLYPEVVQKLLKTLAKKNIVEGEEYNEFTEKKQLFANLAQFLGNHWLTYSLLDAPHGKDDPIGYSQTDRVLNSRVASCEGANIALGELIRHFLNEDEGIAYVKGFNLNENGRGKSYATPEQLHLKVLFKDADNGLYLFDATPFIESSKREITESLKRYKFIKKDWYATLQRVKNGKPLAKTEQEIVEEAYTAWDRLEDVWNYRTYQDRFPSHINMFDQDTTDILGFWGKGLATTLIKEYLPQSFRQFITVTSDSPIEGAMEFSHSPLQQPLFKEGSKYNRADPTTYLPAKSNPDLADKRTRHSVFQPVAEIFVDALHASVQNTEVINSFADQLLTITDEYTKRLQEIFSMHGKIPGGNTEAFVQQAPFLLLLSNPINALESFFQHPSPFHQRGFLKPSDEESIRKNLENRLSQWRETVEKELEVIQAYLPEIPLTKSSTLPVVTFPSLKFWEEAPPIDTSVNEEEQEFYLDPLTTYDFLHNAIYNDTAPSTYDSYSPD